MLGLAVSVLEENQEVTLAHVQAALDGDRARAELAAAAEAVGAAAATPESLPARVAATLEVDGPTPRDPGDPDLARRHGELLGLLMAEAETAPS